MTSYINYLIKQMTNTGKNRYNLKMTSTLNPTLLITNLMKRIVSIAPKKLNNMLRETKQIICQIWHWNQKQIKEKRYMLKYWVILCEMVFKKKGWIKMQTSISKYESVLVYHPHIGPYQTKFKERTRSNHNSCRNKQSNKRP